MKRHEVTKLLSAIITGTGMLIAFGVFLGSFYLLVTEFTYYLKEYWISKFIMLIASGLIAFVYVILHIYLTDRFIKIKKPNFTLKPLDE